MIKTIRSVVFLLALTGLFLLAAGCAKNEAPAPVAVEQVPETMTDAFASAPAPAQEAAQEVVEALEAQDAPRAFVELQALSSRSDLTDSQRAIAAQSLVTVSASLAERAAAGDKAAQAVLEAHRASK
jgi:hypothetical protein